MSLCLTSSPRRRSHPLDLLESHLLTPLRFPCHVEVGSTQGRVVLWVSTVQDLDLPSVCRHGPVGGGGGGGGGHGSWGKGRDWTRTRGEGEGVDTDLWERGFGADTDPWWKGRGWARTREGREGGGHGS